VCVCVCVCVCVRERAKLEVETINASCYGKELLPVICSVAYKSIPQLVYQLNR
jgi:hypothetical protein